MLAGRESVLAVNIVCVTLCAAGWGSSTSLPAANVRDALFLKAAQFQGVLAPGLAVVQLRHTEDDMPTSVRLDPKTEGLVDRLARKTRRTKSQVIRDAIARLAETDERAKRAKTPYEGMKHLIGIARGGPPNLSERTGDKFRQLLRARRPR